MWPDADRRDDALLRLLARVDNTLPRRDSLAPMETRVLEALSHGLGYKGAAEVLGVGIETVKSDVVRARRALQAKDATHAVAIALRSGLIQ